MKVGGKYKSIIRGVSEQAPELRPAGQMTEQINMSSDPVQGLSRRFPTVWQAEKVLATGAYDFAAMTADTANWRTFDYFSAGKDYTLCVNRAGRTTTDLPVCTVYNRTDGAFLDIVRPDVDATLDSLEGGGVSAMTAIGKYVFMAGNDIVPTNTPTDAWGTDANLTKALVWIRGGAFSRTYSVTATKLDNSQVTFSYTTPTASYPGKLDTTGVPAYLPDGTPTGGTGPVLATVSEALSGAAGTVYNLVHAADTPSNVSVAGTQVIPGAGGDSGFDIVTTYPAINGLDYTYASGVVTILRGIPGSTAVTYQYVASGGTAPTVVYATEETTEAARVIDVNGFGAAVLAFKDWSPTGMTVRNGQQTLTNVTPGVPANASQYSWATGAAAVVLAAGLVNSTTVTMTYTHTKTVLNPNYSKQVNDVTNEYNSAVTKWIGDSAKAIQPNNIAESLLAAAITAGLTSAVRQGPNVIFDNVKSLSVDDGGDGTLIRGVADEIASVDETSVTHFVGKVVKVRGKTSKESFYLKATAKDRTVTTGYTEVIWVEGAGVINTTTANFIYGTAIAGNFYMASTASALAVLTGLDDVPDYVASDVGDNDTNPIPYFVGRKVTYLSVFQDRLLVGCGGVIRASAIADYLTFYRSTVLTLPASDAVEFLSQGAADDELRYSGLYDQNLVIFGLKRQYLINGKVPLTPTNANMVPMSSHTEAAELPFVVAGDYILYGKKGPSSSSVHQIQPGQNTSSPASYLISSQIDLYLKGAAIEFSTSSKPSNLFLRTVGKRSSVYLFTYFDTNQGERRLDAWHRWDYNPASGVVIGMQQTAQGLLMFFLRQSQDGDAYVVADLQSLTTGLSPTPYLDSQRLADDLDGSMGPDTTGIYCAYGTATEFKFLGDRLEDRDKLEEDFPSAPAGDLWAGYLIDAQLTPTNPQPRDADGDAVLTGRMVIGSLDVAFTKSSGYVKEQDVFGLASPDDTVTFNGRVFGDPNNLIGREPVTTYHSSIVVGREFRDYELRLKSRKWMPFTITSISWKGQTFNRTPQIKG